MSSFGGFGATTPAPAASGGFNFSGSSTNTSSAPAAFGSTPPAPVFGSTPAPGTTATGGLFGTTSTATAPLFGAATAPLFGSPSPAAAPTFGAPTGGILFGGSSAASSSTAPTTNIFGAPPAAPSGAFNFGAPAAGAPPPAPTGSIFSAQPQPPPQQQPVATISGSTPYSALPPEMKRAIDNMYQAIQNHQRTMANVKTMGPRILQPAENTTAATNTTVLQERIDKLRASVDGLRNDMEYLERSTEKQHKASQDAIVESYKYAKWPVEALVVRKGLRLQEHKQEEKKASSVDEETAEMYRRIRQALDEAVADVDRIEQMPSPYFWNVLHNLEERATQLSQQAASLQAQLDQARETMTAFNGTDASTTPMMIREIVYTQHIALQRIKSALQKLHYQMERVRLLYRRYERGENVLEKAQLAQMERERRLQERIQMDLLQAAAPATSNAPAAPAPSSTAFSFAGGSTAPTTTNLFGSAPTAPFTSATTTTTNVFGSSTPATPAFGSSSSPSSSSSSKKKSSSRSSGRLRR